MLSKNSKCSRTKAKKKENGVVPPITPSPSLFLSLGPKKSRHSRFGRRWGECTAWRRKSYLRERKRSRDRAGGSLQAEPPQARGKEESLECPWEAQRICPVLLYHQPPTLPCDPEALWSCPCLGCAPHRPVPSQLVADAYLDPKPLEGWSRDLCQALNCFIVLTSAVREGWKLRVSI